MYGAVFVCVNRFGQFGVVTAVQDIPHKGFSYVTLENTDEARVKRLIFTLNSIKFKGQTLKIAVAKKEWQQTFAERQESDVKTEEERLRLAQKKMERRADAKLLPPPTAVSTASAFDDETFKPSNPYGWMKVKGRYVAIFRAPKKGREGGVLIEPKSRAHLIQPILCHVKPIRIASILTELPDDVVVEDEEYSTARKEEVDRWASGLIKQRRAAGRSIADYSTFNNRSDDSDDESGGKKKQSKANGRKRADSDSDDFEVVGGSDDSDNDSDADSYADSFSDIEEIAGVKGKKKQPSAQDSKTSSSANKPGSVSAVDSQSKMLSVIDSILKRKQGSDYGDSDSQDFEANPSSGESSSGSDDDENDQTSDSDKETSKSRKSSSTLASASSSAQRAKMPIDDSNDSEEDDDESSEDDASSDSSDISAKDFSDDDDDGAKGVVDFDSDDDDTQVQQPVESMDVDSSGEDESQDSPLSGAPHAARSSDDADSTDSSSESDDDLQVNMQVDDEVEEVSDEAFEAENASESSQFEDEDASSEYEDNHDAEESRNALKSLARGVAGPERLKVVGDDSDDDIGLNIYSSAPAPKPIAPKSSVKAVTGPERLKVVTDDSDDDIGLNIYSSAPSPKPTPAPKSPAPKSSISSVIGPERLKVDADDSDDDIGLNIFSSAPKPKAAPVVVPKEVTPKPQVVQKETPLPATSKPAAAASKPTASKPAASPKPENAKKRKRNRKRGIEAPSDSSDTSDSDSSSETEPAALVHSWSADLVAENKRYAYSELVREQDEKIFAAMRDDTTSTKPVVKTFSFLAKASESEEKVEAPLVAQTSLLDLLPSLSSASSSNVSKSLLGAKKPSLISTDGDESKASSAPKIERSKMSLFGGLTSPSSNNNGTKTGESTSSSSFVRTTEVDRINKLWGSTKGAQRQLAERNHKLATKRVKPSK